MSAACQERVQSSNGKSLPLLGLIAHILTRRRYGFGRCGGGRGAGLEPSPRRPGWGKVSQRTPGLQPTCQGVAKTADARKGRRRALYRAKAPATVNFRRGLSSEGIFAFVASLGACLLRRVS